MASSAPQSIRLQTRGNYFLHMRFRHDDFVLAELDAVLEMHGLEPSSVYDRSVVDITKSPFIRCNFPSDDVARAVASRAILVKSVYDLWGMGRSAEAVVKQMQALPADRTDRFMEETAAWRLDVSCFGNTITEAQQEEKRKLFKFIKFRGPVRLNRKDLSVHRFMFIEDYGCPTRDQLTFSEEEEAADGVDKATTTTTETTASSHTGTNGPLPAVEAQLFVFGRWLADGRKDLIEKYTLKKRAFLGPTSMDTELSFIMGNMIKIRPGSIVLDPFCGTGSILISATVFGARAMGMDIDPRILSGKQGKNLFSNFDQYKLPHPDIMRSDFSPLGCCLRALPAGFFDAICCDPPYGVRAGARKVGVAEHKKGKMKKVQSPIPTPGDGEKPHHPRSQPYDGVELMHDLLDSAARLLVLGGRLAYLLPVVVQEYSDDDIPRHPCLRVVANSENRLSIRLARRLITMEKIVEYDAEQVSTQLALLAAQRNDNNAFADLAMKVHPGRHRKQSATATVVASSAAGAASAAAAAASAAAEPPQDPKRICAEKQTDDVEMASSNNEDASI